MTMWLVIMYATLMITGASLLYLSNRVGKFRIFKTSEEKKKNRFMLGTLTVFLIFGLIGLAINFINAVVCAIYFALIWLVSDVVFFVVEKIRHKPFEKYFAGMFAIVASIAALSCGWYLNHNVWQTTYVIETDKAVKDIKIIMFADSHTGTTFRAEGFARHIAAMQAQNPDMVKIGRAHV